MRTTRFALIVILCGASSALSARAQNTASSTGLFVGGGAFADLDHTWGTDATSAGFNASAGLDVDRHLGVRVGIEVPRTVVVPCGTRCVERHRSLSWSALIDLHGQVSGRVRVGVLAGITSASHFSVFALSTDSFGTGDTFPWWGAAVGVEFPVALTRHLSIAPEARLEWFPLADYGRTTIFRPGASIRWRF